MDRHRRALQNAAHASHLQAMKPNERVVEALRASIAGGEAVAVRGAAEVLFAAGGKKVLSEGSQRVLREVVTKAVGKTLEAGRGAAQLASGMVTREVAKSATREVAKGLGRAAALGLAFDAVIGTIEGVVAVRSGEKTVKQAVVHASKEAGTGALASAGGVAAAAALVALTGGLAAPVVFGVGAVTAVSIKLGLSSLIKPRAAIVVTAPAA
jgi:hypothetical protein